MASQRFQRLKVFACSTVVIGLAILLVGLPATTGQSARSRDSADAWTSQQTIEPAALAKKLSQTGQRPTVVCVGFRTLFEGAHVPGASFHGPAMDANGLADLKKWAQPLPRSAQLVVYCGCCPLAHCPNIRPAFEALHAMGFTHLKVLLLPHDFAHDWVQSGYPAAKGSDGADDVERHPSGGVLGSNIGGDGGAPARIRVRSDVQRHHLIHMVYPLYPEDAVTRQLEGTVSFHAIIATDGTVKELRYISGPQSLVRSALSAVREWRYRPTLVSGKPVEVDTTISVVYKLGG